MKKEMPAAKRRVHPPNWAVLPHCPPYYIYYPNPETLQIWVKPRYFFAYATAALFLLGLAFLIIAVALPDAALPQFKRFLQELFWFLRLFLQIFNVSAEFVTREQLLIASLALLFGPFAAVMLIYPLYKRDGLLEVTRAGLLKMRNPRFFPRDAFFFAAEDITKFTDKALYSRGARTGMALEIASRDGLSSEIMRVYAAPEDYQLLSAEIKKAFVPPEKKNRSPRKNLAMPNAIPAPATRLERRRAEIFNGQRVFAGHLEKFCRLRYLLPIYLTSLLYQVWFHLFTDQQGFGHTLTYIIGFLHINVMLVHAGHLFDSFAYWRFPKKAAHVAMFILGFFTWNFRYPRVEELIMQEARQSTVLTQGVVIDLKMRSKGSPVIEYAYDFEGKKYRRFHAWPNDIAYIQKIRLEANAPLTVQVNRRFPALHWIIWEKSGISVKKRRREKNS